MRTLMVELGVRSYPIYIGASLLKQSGLVDKHVRGKQVLIVSNTTVAPLYLDRVESLFSEFQCAHVVLPDGESHKTLGTLLQIFDELLRHKHDRTTTLVALGGGVIGDMTGFAAACYQRGVAFIQIPTTLLAQVDSSVGGKTGVNHPLGKNMIGAFHQPSCVLIDTDTLLTLPEREYRSGLAEVVKYGLISDEVFFDWIERNVDALLARDAGVLVRAIECSCASKAAIVAVDENENGVRALLNLGHTFGHAIESWQEYKSWLHGEAVAAGTVVAAEMSVMLGMLTRAKADRICALFSKMGLPCGVPAGMDNATFIDFMQRDKKVIDGRMRLILLQDIGKGIIVEDVGVDQISTVLECCRSPIGD